MSSETSFVLIRRLADGTVEWIPLEVSPHRVLVAPNAAYTLVDRANYEAPQTLEVQRVGENLVVKVEGAEVLALDGFFTNVGVNFYPTTNVAAGAGPFSGPALTAASPELALPAGAVVASSAANADGDDGEDAASGTGAGAGSGGAAAASGAGGGSSPLVWIGAAVGGLGLAAAAGGGGGGSGGGSGGGPPVADTTPPQITSSATPAAVGENAGAGQVVYTATATDAGVVTYSLRAVGDAASFTINANTGAVSLTDNPNFETKASYSFTVAATDAANNSSERAVTLAINNRDESAPTITSGGTAPAINENGAAGQVVYTVTSTDTGDISTGSTTYSLKAGVGEAAAFSINANTGAVTLTGIPDFEAKPSYGFTVVATDAASNSSEHAVTLAINNLPDSPVTITSGGTATAIDENVSAPRVVYTVAATAIAPGPLTYSLKAGGDAAAFTINPNSGAVTLTGSPNFETKPSYNFTVIATDTARNTGEQAVSLAINNKDEVAPTITSSGTATALNENSGAGQVIYTVTSTDTGDITTGSTIYSLKAGGDAAAFTINAGNGQVTLTANPNDETKGSYAFTVVATDAAGNFDEQAVSLGINDLDDSPPTITSGGTAPAINENSGAGQVIYTVTSTDTGDISTGSTTYSLKAGGDAAAFTINAGNGQVRLTANPDDETNGSYNFTVVATDAAGNFSERAVSLGINDLDEVAPNITSGSTATAITENSGANQLVYTVTSTDSDIVSGSTTYSLTGADAADFTINATSGAVRLTANPNFEGKSSYSFTVVATDGGNNSDTQAVSLAINDIADETPPEVDQIQLTGAIGGQNGRLNAGDIVSVTVTMDENTLVSGGTPSIGLSIGGVDVNALYVSGSGTANLIFQYTIRTGENDDNGISIRADTLAANGASIRDPSGNVADLDHGAVSSNSSFIVDTRAPTLSSTTPTDDDDDVDVDDDIELTFSENVVVGSGNIVISSAVDTRTIDVNDPQVSISGNDVTINPTSNLFPVSSYSVRIDAGAFTDQAGNAFAGISNDTTFNFDTEGIVVPLLFAPESDLDSGRLFASENEEIGIRIAGDEETIDSGPDAWTGSADLGSEDRVMLAGRGVGPVAPSAAANETADASVAWQTSPGFDDPLHGSGLADPSLTGAALGVSQTDIISFANLPAVTSQGLA